ncbi:MAG: hypothetical protein M0P91_08100 [Sulfuricurvum sp.]|uniref:hypothetical protein n=1 Tax=Sulfuricurvum sp. TaxID=2025608 RepID=UPI0025DBBBB9|nr:hypothetical protein [Sulfuricurvum sp.]MCK9373147.1 hypothetical protein [Sulfuricurvum sp.]
MSFSFLHPEFFFWMVIPVVALFYLWMTQKSSEQSLFSLHALERLRPPPVTMGLAGRNRLFLSAALLLITAMAGPVAFEEGPRTAPRTNVLIAIDISIQSPENFAHAKERAIALILGLRGENVGVVAYDSVSYFVAPLSRDTFGVSELVRGMDPSLMQTERGDREGLITALKDHYEEGDDPLILVSSSFPTAVADNDLRVISMEPGEATDAVVEKIRAVAYKNAQASSIPLFFYPLGGAMVLIGIALSSMSQRRSVPVAAVLLSFAVQGMELHAGVFDFTLLDEAVASYEREEYPKSAALFRSYQQKHDGARIRYNLANALYRSGRYAEAQKWYETIYTTDPVLAEHVRYNLGRAVAMMEQTKGREGKKTAKEEGQSPFLEPNPPLKPLTRNGSITRLYPIR